MLRPPQAQLLRAVAQINRNRDPKAPRDLTDEQRQILYRDPHLVDLRRQREAIRREICFGGLPLSHVKGTELHQQHAQLGKAITRRRQDLRRMGRDHVKKTYHSEMPIMEIDKQIDAMQGVESNDVALPELEEDWIPPAPTFGCKEHERIADAFFGPTAETLTGAEALSRRIQVVNDLAVIREMREPPKRGPKLKWAKYNEEIDPDKPNVSVELSNTLKSEDTLWTPDLTFPTDQCMVCLGDASLHAFHPRSKQRPDSLRRHLENQHLSRLTG